MSPLATTLKSWVANFSAVNADVQGYIQPILLSLIGVASLASVLFIVIGGIEYMTSSANPERLDHAKKVLRNALIGLVMVIGTTAFTTILTGSYDSSGGSNVFQGAPTLEPVEVSDTGGGITEVLLNAIIGLFKHLIATAASPIINSIDFFTSHTPLMADNEGVFNLWLASLGIANGLFVLVIALIGFQVMSAASLGLDEVNLRQLLPKIAMTFLLMNVSIFAIDAIIGVSNIMITAISSDGGNAVFTTLTEVLADSGKQGLVSLMLMIVFLSLSVLLLVYYVSRIIALYVGAVLSPLVAMLQILPGFRDFTATATRAYVTTIFNLFVHVVILLIAAGLFTGLKGPDPEDSYNPLMSLVGGIAAIFTLLKAQQVMMTISYASSGAKSMRKMSKQFIKGVTHMTSSVKASKAKKEALAKKEGTSPTNKRRTAPTKEGYK